MTDQPLDLDAIDARANAATPGPWFNDSHEIYAGENTDIPAMSEWIGETCDPRRPDHGAANAEFIAAARTDVPALLAEVRRLTAELAHEQQRVAYWQECRDNYAAENRKLLGQRKELCTELEQAARRTMHDPIECEHQAEAGQLAEQNRRLRDALHSIESDAERAARKGYDLDAEDIRATAHHALNPAAVSGT